MKIISFDQDIPSGAIRNRIDVIRVIEQACQFILDGKYTFHTSLGTINPDKPFLYIDTMQRMFIPEETRNQGVPSEKKENSKSQKKKSQQQKVSTQQMNSSADEENVRKIYSIVFPFQFTEKPRRLSINDYDITDTTISDLRALYSAVEKELKVNIEFATIDDLAVAYDSVFYCRNGSSVQIEKDTLRNFVTELWTFDIGYLRFDHDEENSDEKNAKDKGGSLHPTNHLDINYTTASTYKIGLHQQLDVITFTEILEEKKLCWVLKQSSVK